MEATCVKMITQAQIKKIWAMARNLNLEKDDLYKMIGIKSLKDLEEIQANLIIKHLNKMLDDTGLRQAKKHKEIPGMATSGQQAKVWALMYELEKKGKYNKASLGNRLCALIKKELGVDADAKNPFVWIDTKACDKLIEVLKNYVANIK